MNVNCCMKYVLRQTRCVSYNLFKVQRRYIVPVTWQRFKDVGDTGKFNVSCSSLLLNNLSKKDCKESKFRIIDDVVMNKNNLVSLNEKDAIILLESCENRICSSTSTPYYKEIWKTLEEIGFNFKSIHYHTYIKLCTKNHNLIEPMKFLSRMKCEPDLTTYKLLFENTCEKGDVQQALIILNLLKDNKVQIDEEIFNLLVLCHTISGGMKSCKSVLETMKLAHVPESTKTKIAILRGTIIRSDYKEFNEAVNLYPMKLNDEELLQLLLDLGFSNNYVWTKEIFQMYCQPEISRQLLNGLEHLCIKLINMKRPEAAFSIYHSIVPSSIDQNYCTNLIEELFAANTPLDIVVDLVNRSNKFYPDMRILEVATEYALKNNHFDAVWAFLNYLKPLRPHYFWPLLINAANKNGETEVIETLKKMNILGIKADADSFETYILPLCDLSRSNILLTQIQSIGYTVTELLTSFLVVLLNHYYVKEARKLCESYNIRLNGERLLLPLVKAWTKNKDAINVIFILQRIYETNSVGEDWVGTFLIGTLKKCCTNEDKNMYVKLLEHVQKQRLHITSISAETLTQIATRNNNSNFEKMQELVDQLLDFTKKQNESHIPHPRDMSLEQLEYHLIELENKHMGTRGVLRKLLLLHSGLGNYERVQQLRQKFLECGYDESAGLITAMMHSYIKSNHLNLALNMYNEVKSSYPKFVIDEFKIIDLATLMVNNNDFKSAMELLQSESTQRRIKGGPGIINNCRNLLSATKDPNEILELFKFLVDKGYCKVSNIILGPLVRMHLNRQDLESATNFYIDCANKHNCTPLQLELLCKLIEAQKETLFKQALEATSKVHGVTATKVSIFAALAENRLKKPLLNLLAETSFCKSDLHNRCKRWVSEGKLLPLETVANVVETKYTDKIDLPFIHLCIMQLHSSKNDCEAALLFWNKLTDKESYISSDVNKELYELLKRCKYSMPGELEMKIS